MEVSKSNGLGFTQEGYGECGLPMPRRQAEVDPLIKQRKIVEAWQQGYDLGDTGLCEQAEADMEQLIVEHPDLVDTVKNF